MLMWLERGTLDPYEQDDSRVAAAYRSVSHDDYKQASVAGDIMSSPVQTIEASSTLAEAFVLMEDLGISHLGVLKDGHFSGLISDRDVLIADDTNRTVESAMSTELLLASPEEPIWRIASIMVQHRVNCVPILNHEFYLIGLLTTTDILGCMTYQASTEFWA
jgi:CBS domain-containing protein